MEDSEPAPVELLGWHFSHFLLLSGVELGATGGKRWSNQGSTEQPRAELRGQQAVVVTLKALRGRPELEVRTNPEDLPGKSIGSV